MRRTHGAEIRAVTLFRETGNDAQRTTPTRPVADRECRPGTADLLGRCFGFVYGHLDARTRVLDVDGLQNGIASMGLGHRLGELSLPWCWQGPSTCASGGCGGYPVTNDTSDG